MATPPENVDTTTAPAVETDAATGAKQDITPQQLAIVGGVVLVILLGLVYFFFLRGGGEEEQVATPPVAEGVPAPEETVPPEDGEDDEEDGGEVETFEVFAPRDPFESLLSASGGGAPPADDGTTDDGTTGDGGDGDGTTDPPPGEEPGPGDGEDIGEHRVSVVDVYSQDGEERAQIRVDGTVYTVDEGENFADNFRLVSASGRCATILFGDDEFTLCEGEEILK